MQTLKPRVASLPASRLRSTASLGTTNPDSWRTGRTTSERGYGWQWQKARAGFLRHPENVLCRSCVNRGATVVATVVDHIIPHRGDQALFWERSNWQPLCKRCHDVKTASEESEAGR